MRLPLIKYGNIALTIITTHQKKSPLFLLLLVRLGGYKVNSLDCYGPCERLEVSSTSLVDVESVSLFIPFRHSFTPFPTINKFKI
jgi:hypothetical protein